MAEYWSLKNKEITSITLDKNLYDDLDNYANLLHLNKSEAINEILFKFFKSKILTNTYLTNRAGLQFKIPLDLDIKKECIRNKTILNVDDSDIGSETALITFNRIPNNLDIFTLSDDNTAGSFKANIKDVLHHGIDFVFIPEVIKKPINPDDKFITDLVESLYIFYFEVKANNTNVYLINPIEAINNLSNANNKDVADKLSELVQMLELEQKQINYEYKSTMEHLYKGKRKVTDKRVNDVINTHFKILEMDLLKNNSITDVKFKNDNVSVNLIN